MTASKAPGRTALVDSVRTVLHDTARLYADDPRTRQRLVGQLERLDEPLRIAIAGKIKAGKSTLLNALVGEQVAATEGRSGYRCTAATESSWSTCTGTRPTP